MIYDLVMGLQVHLQELFADAHYYIKPSKGAEGTTGPPDVLAFSRPSEVQGQGGKRAKDSIYPYVAICVSEGSFGEEDLVTVTFVCGVESPIAEGHDGYQDILQMVERLGHALRKKPIIEGRYAMAAGSDDAIPFTLGNNKIGDQPEPYYGGFIVTKWQLPGVPDNLLED